MDPVVDAVVLAAVACLLGIAGGITAGVLIYIYGLARRIGHKMWGSSRDKIEPPAPPPPVPPVGSLVNWRPRTKLDARSRAQWPDPWLLVMVMSGLPHLTARKGPSVLLQPLAFDGRPLPGLGRWVPVAFIASWTPRTTARRATAGQASRRHTDGAALSTSPNA